MTHKALFASRALLLLFYALFTVLPIYWAIKLAFTPTRLFFSEGVRWWPSSTTLQHFSDVWSWSAFHAYFLNSLLVSLSSASLATVLSSPAGYALARLKLPGKNFALAFLFVTQMISTIAIIVPLTSLLNSLGLSDSRLGLVLAYTAINLPFAIFLMASFFENLPSLIEEAAILDGYNRAELFISILLPLVRPGLMTVIGFTFIESWSELFLAVTLINTESEKTIPAGLLSLFSKVGVDWGQVSAAGLIAAIPACLFFILIQRFLVSGFSAGAIKG